MVLWATKHVLENKGAKTAGIDKITKIHLQNSEVKMKLVHEIVKEIRNNRYEPNDIKRVLIPKKKFDNKRKRPLGIPTIKDRIVQEVFRLLLNPIAEGLFYQHSYGFRDFRSCAYAVQRIWNLMVSKKNRKNFYYIIEGDISKAYEKVNHDRLLEIIEQDVCKDKKIIKIIRNMLKSKIIFNGEIIENELGTPQGGLISPLLFNIYMNRFDWFIFNKYLRLNKRKRSISIPQAIIRYADDFVILTDNEYNARRIKKEIREWLKEELKLELSDEKTLITPLNKGFDFLGFNIKEYKNGKVLITPSKKTIRKFRLSINEAIRRNRQFSVEKLMKECNSIIRGYGYFFSTASSKKTFSKLQKWIFERIKKELKRRHPSKSIKWIMKKYYDKKRYYWMAEKIQLERMSDIPIVYVRNYPQLNSYIESDYQKIIKNKILWQTLRREAHPLKGDFDSKLRQIRTKVLEEQNGCCNNCKEFIANKRFELHHINGKETGYDKRENLEILCKTCHNQKTARDLNP